MTWFVNDLSLAGQYPTSEAFVGDLKQFLALRNRSPLLASRLFCSRTIVYRQAAPKFNLREAVNLSGDRDLIRLVLNWLTKSGPFWEDERQPAVEDYFHCHQTEVTEFGLGEAARRKLGGESTNSISFPGAGFDYSPLPVVQGLLEEPTSTIEVENQWKWEDVQRAVEAAMPPIINWEQMLTEARGRFDHLDLVADCGDPLKSEPFSQHVVKRVFELLKVLNEYISCMAETCAPTERNHELFAQHFTGEKSLFSDESTSNKQDFKNKLEFPDPAQPGKKIFCPWHGKINTPTYRIHFEWPPRPNVKLRIVYIGPKITKI